MIKKLLSTLMLSLTCAVAAASGGGHPLDKAPDRITDLAALQNGAKLFVNYCLNCHSANSMRYNKLTEIGLTDEQIKQNLLFTADKVGALMHVAMRPEDAKKWFGAAPPDLSVIARAKSENMGASGVDYVYTFLRTFYRDTSRPTGWNNLVFPKVGMPNPLWQLQGPRSLQITAIHGGEGAEGEHGGGAWERTVTTYDPQGYATETHDKLESYTGDPGEKALFTAENTRQQVEFDNQVADIANFLGWMAEPQQLLRKQMGVWVLLFLGLFLLVAWRLNAAYWKHVK
jgi:ubiquinol-cytochrome c reductase cytochrome c1 subunit